MNQSKPPINTELMNKRIFTILTSLTILCAAASSQSFSDIRKDASYIFAEGTGAAVTAADSAALGGIVFKLSQEADFPYPSVTKTKLMYSYLDDIRRECGMISASGPQTATVMRYIKRDDVGMIYARRRDKVKEMVSIAKTAEMKCQMDVALRYYSWAETLMRSLPRPDVTAIAEVKSRREDILKNLNVTFDRQSVYDKGVVEISFTCHGKPVRNIDYRFFDGEGWSGVLSAKDGKGFVEVRPDSKIELYRIKYEITPAHLHHLFREVAGVEKAFDTDSGEGVAATESPKPTATEARGKEVPAKVASESSARKIDFAAVKKKVLEVATRDEFQTEPDSSRGGVRPIVMTADYEEIVSRVCRSVSQGTYDSVRECFTEEGYDTFSRLIRYGNAKVLNYDGLNFYGLGDEVFCGSVPMVFSFNGNKRRFVESVVFTFDSAKKICDLTFSLDKETVRGIISQDSWTEEARIILINFLESYKTAYALKRLDYISSIFDDDALIITGRVLRNVKGPNEFSNNRYVTFTRQSKANYIKNLQRVFASQEYINLQFADCEVTKLGKGEQLFGIKIRQEYFSATYSDTGYLFILVDLRDYQRPVIHVRTWQDEPDKEFGVIGPYNF